MFLQPRAHPPASLGHHITGHAVLTPRRRRTEYGYAAFQDRCTIRAGRVERRAICVTVNALAVSQFDVPLGGQVRPRRQKIAIAIDDAHRSSGRSTDYFRCKFKMQTEFRKHWTEAAFPLSWFKSVCI